MHIAFAGGIFILSYIIELLLCFKAKGRQTKMIPFYVCFAIAFFGLLVYGELFGDMSGGFLGNAHILVAIIIEIAVLIMFTALFLAQITYMTVKYIQRKKKYD